MVSEFESRSYGGSALRISYLLSVRISKVAHRVASYQKCLLRARIRDGHVRRLIVEIPVDDLEADSPIHKLKSFEILHILRITPEEVAALVRVEHYGDVSDAGSLLPDSQNAEIKYEFLEEKENARTYFMTIRTRQGRQLKLTPIPGGGYLSVPIEVRDGKLKVTFLGTAKQIGRVLRFLDKGRTRYRLVSLMDAKFSSDSPLARLTAKQRDVLKKAYELGYYDRPRRITSDGLAKGLNLAKSTLVAHRRKAERRLLSEILSKA